MCSLPSAHRFWPAGEPGHRGTACRYIEEQLNDFKNGRRHSSVPDMAATLMIKVADAVSPEDAKAAAEYFASVKLTKWIHVKESATAPKVHSTNWMWVPDEGNATEPIGERVVEVPENTERVEMRDTSSLHRLRALWKP